MLLTHHIQSALPFTCHCIPGLPMPAFRGQWAEAFVPAFALCLAVLCLTPAFHSSLPFVARFAHACLSRTMGRLLPMFVTIMQCVQQKSVNTTPKGMSWVDCCNVMHAYVNAYSRSQVQQLCKHRHESKHAKAGLRRCDQAEEQKQDFAMTSVVGQRSSCVYKTCSEWIVRSSVAKAHKKMGSFAPGRIWGTLSRTPR